MTRIIPAATLLALLLLASCSDAESPPAIPHAIAGTVAGAGEVTVTLSGAATSSTTTDAAGRYEFAGLADGSYTVSPSRPGYAFVPPSRPVALAGADVPGQDFTAAYALDGTSWSACAPEENFPQDAWTAYTFVGDTLHVTQIEYSASSDGTCSGGAHASPDSAGSGTFVDAGEVAATLRGAPVTARAVVTTIFGATFDSLLYVDFAAEPDALYVGFGETVTLWPQPQAKEALEGDTAPALQGTWVACVTDGPSDVLETYAFTGYRLAVARDRFPSTNASCTGAATRTFEDAAVLVLRAATTATLEGAPVPAREWDAVFDGGLVIYSIFHVDSAATPEALYSGDRTADAARDGTAPDRRPIALEHWKRRVRHP